ncbi:MULTISPECIES: cytochrome b/b6 domain-containing protein [Metallosphaera]|uniref:cytochrome b/b6 domain-containing protein n=1 Tax=Metallosphaera TaxID=41980 RepID=UPI001F05D1B1|nr:cytochrome b/b6 domain-containing protein [Metallosphaera sedula]MCH1770451.1 Rieske 2Fe-2S domain-containing protein [Metallosphaera sedula]
MRFLQFLAEFVILISLAGIFLYHLARGKLVEASPPTNGKRTVLLYSEGQRIFHWASFGALLIAGISGYYMLTTTNLGLLNFHDWTLLPIGLLLLYHWVSDGRSGEMRLSLDLRVKRAKGKYHPLKRAYHVGVVLSMMGLGLTGLALWNPLKLSLLFPYFQDLLILHVLSALLLTSLAIFHVYLSLMPSNRPLLEAMKDGLLDEGYLRAHYDWTPPRKRVEKVVNEGRRTFLKTVGVTALALALVAILGRNSAPSSPSSSGSQGSLQTQASYGPIANANQMGPNSAKLFRLPNGSPGILVKLPNGQLKAYSAVCTHAGCTVGYLPGQQLIACPCHGAEFSPSNGGVIAGPAPYPLPQYLVTVDSSGNVYIGNVSSSSSTSGSTTGYGGDDGGNDD